MRHAVRRHRRLPNRSRSAALLRLRGAARHCRHRRHPWWHQSCVPHQLARLRVRRISRAVCRTAPLPLSIRRCRIAVTHHRPWRAACLALSDTHGEQLHHTLGAVAPNPRKSSCHLRSILRRRRCKIRRQGRQHSDISSETLNESPASSASHVHDFSRTPSLHPLR